MRAALTVTLFVLVLAGVAVACCGCAASSPRAIWFKNPPPDWTPPAPYRHCRVQGEIVLDTYQRVMRLDCPDVIVLVDTQTKRTVRKDLR